MHLAHRAPGSLGGVRGRTLLAKRLRLVDALLHPARAQGVLRHHPRELGEVEPAAPVEVKLVEQRLRVGLGLG